MPVFIPSQSLGKADGGPGHYAYGNDVYKQVTKMKTAVVVDVLKHHRDVIWCDPDIVLYRPFVADLMAGEHDFQLQNNNPTSLETNLLKTNSGFYYVRSTQWVIAALSAVVVHASKSAESEQMSWNAVLCAEQDASKDQCFYEGNVLQFLNRAKYATGNEADVAWEQVKGHTQPKTLIAWHNNWITGYDAKLERLAQIDQLWWDAEWGHCASSDERKMMNRYFKQQRLTAVFTSWGDWPKYLS
jgi:hypothetical protein